MESFPLFVMALALSAGALVLGVGAERLRARGVPPHYALAFVAMLSIAVQLALILRLPIPSKICWDVVAAAGAASVLSYASLAEYFPKQVIGRANGALGVVDIGGAFVLQYATGLVIQQWPAPGGHYPVTAYQMAFTINVVLQLFAVGWFVLPYVRERVSAFASDLLGRSAFRFDNHPRSSSFYDRAAQVWAARIVAARREAMNWRLAALGSMSLTALLGLAIAMSAGRASVVRYVTEVQSLPEVATAKVALEPERTLHTQIVFPWDQSSTNTPSLSIDLATIRERWLDAYSYDYVEDREVETFNDYNRADGSLARPLSSVHHRRNHPWHRHRSHQTR